MELTNNVLETLEEQLKQVLLEKAETDIEIRRGELNIKKINALANLEKAKLDFMKLQLEQQRVALDERRLTLEEIQTKYNITSDMVRKSDKIQRAIGKTMLGLFPEQDKQVVQIMKAAKELNQEKYSVRDIK